MPRWIFASLVVPFVVSCALPAGETDRSAAPQATAETPIDLGDIDDVAPRSDVEAASEESGNGAPVYVPKGIFASLDALCEAQTSLILPTLRAAQALRDERAGEDVPEQPRCERMPSALENVTVRLHAPFLEIETLAVETGYATEVHLAVRTAEGWIAIPHPSVVSYHDDPGCFTIERDSGLTSVTVVGDDSASLELVETSSRGALIEYAEDESGTTRTFDDVTERAVGCSISSGKFACAPPTVLSLTRVLTSS
jgi:hypothetical protein